MRQDSGACVYTQTYLCIYLYSPAWKYMCISIEVITYMQAASILKPFALSLQLLPSADRCFTCQWNQVIFIYVTDRHFTCQCMNISKKINADRKNTCQAVKFDFFSEICYFSIALTGKVPVNNKKPQPFTPIFFSSDRCFTCQWLKSYILLRCLTSVLPVSDNF